VSYLHEWAATAAFGRGAAEGWKCKHNQTNVFPPATRRGRDLCRVKPPSRVISSA
jgi:hypothetical protein